MANLYGWIVYNGNLITDKFIDYVSWFQQAAQKQNITVDAIPNNRLLVTTTSKGPAITGFGNKKPDFVHFADKDLHLARQLEALNIPVFNNSRAIELCDNKAYMYQRLSEKGVPIPETIIAPKIYNGLPLQDQSHIDLVIEELGFPLIIKEAYGSFGKQVYWVENQEELTKRVTQLTGTEFVFQKPVHSSLGKDTRLNLVGNQVVTSMMRTSDSDFRANVTAGGKTMPYTPTAEEIDLAIKSAKAVDCDFAGVDLLFGEDGPILCEVNSNPHLRSIFECTGVDVADEMIHYIRKAVQEN
ncbi:MULTISPECIES: ATP-grasp domain-containing protein [Bacillaceae]|uniref:RimK family alpha-L-glutamate ligase n=1 Tax=Evansella alkalicola TaxID=745819 RepID=A0ABS6JTU9_9BACI|nr:MULTISPECIES: RimK family alpha-L-glutamate ligase [Bacillaceae]MBU9721923.1 RimK family alpha-L-glutamate ligase [Bacillus alkalicola]